jgi:hypothetical protein
VNTRTLVVSYAIGVAATIVAANVAPAYVWWVAGAWIGFIFYIISLPILRSPETGQHDKTLQLSNADLAALPHKMTPPIAITSGSIALIVAIVGLNGNREKIEVGPFYSYAVTGLLGAASLTIGIFSLMQRSRVLTSFRLELLRLQGRYTRSISPLRRRIIVQRDALIKSGDLADANRATEVLRSLDRTPSRRRSGTPKPPSVRSRI